MESLVDVCIRDDNDAVTVFINEYTPRPHFSRLSEIIIISTMRDATHAESVSITTGLGFSLPLQLASRYLKH